MNPWPKLTSLVAILGTVLTAVLTWATASDPDHALLSIKAVALIGLVTTVVSALSHSLTGDGGAPMKKP